MAYQKFNEVEIIAHNYKVWIGKLISLDKTKALSQKYLRHSSLVAYYIFYTSINKFIKCVNST